MILSVDIGNTTISMAVVQKGKVFRLWSIVTVLDQKSLRRQLDKDLEQIKKKCPGIQKAVICSVVPRVLPIVSSRIALIFKIKPFVIGTDILVPLKNLYRNPKQVGQDRLVCAYAAMNLYGLPSIVIDLGTAITLDVVSEQKEYLGGIIVPGIRLSAESLFKKTALLPLTKIKKPQSLIGKDTEESILSGLFYGYGALCRGLIEELKREVNAKPKVVITGGYAMLMKKFIISKITIVDQHLVHKGIALLSSF